MRWLGGAAGDGVPERWLAESSPVLSSGAQSHHGRIITRMGTTADTDHIPIMDPDAAACGMVTLGYPLASYKLERGCFRCLEVGT